MSNVEHIVLHTSLPPEEAAQRLAEALHATLARHEDGAVSVRRPLQLGAGEGTIGGAVKRNDLGEDNPEPGEESIYDGYDTMYEIWSTLAHGEDRERFEHAEAARIFTEITESLPWPAVHAEEGGRLYSAWNLQRGRTDFPDGTGCYADDRDRWRPYAHPTVPE